MTVRQAGIVSLSDLCNTMSMPLGVLKVVVVFLLLCGSVSCQLFPGWKYYEHVLVTGGNTVQTDYAVRVMMDTQTKISNGWF